MNFKILIPILAIVLVAGCTIPDLGDLGTGTSLVGGNGLSVTSFTVEPTTVLSGSALRVVVEAQNLGGTTVSKDDSLLYLTGTDVSLSDTSGDYWSGRNTSDQTPIKHFNKNMTTANVVKGTSAVTDTVRWNLVAPTNIPSGQTRQDTFILRVYSKYSSGVNGNIWVYSESESEATKSAGRTLQTSSFTPVTGPVAVNIKLSPDPIVLFSGESTFTFDITLTNTATGSIYSKNINYASAGISDLSLSSETELNYVTVTVDSGSLTTTDCSGPQQILGGKSLTLTCTATVPNANTLTFQSFPLNVKVDYGYYTENEATVTIQGK